MTDKELLNKAISDNFSERIPADSSSFHRFSLRYRLRKRTLLKRLEAPKNRSHGSVKFVLAAAVICVMLVTAFIGGYSVNGFTVVFSGDRAQVVQMNVNKALIHETCTLRNDSALLIISGTSRGCFRATYCIEEKQLVLRQYTAEAAKSVFMGASPRAVPYIDGFMVQENHRCTLFWEQEGYLISLRGNFSVERLTELAEQVTFD